MIKLEDFDWWTSGVSLLQATWPQRGAPVKNNNMGRPNGRETTGK
jgi:hypothetical protein